MQNIPQPSLKYDECPSSSFCQLPEPTEDEEYAQGCFEQQNETKLLLVITSMMTSQTSS